MIQNGVYNKVTEESRQTVCVKPTGAVYALVAMHTLTTMQNLISNRNANLPPKKNLKKNYRNKKRRFQKAEPNLAPARSPRYVHIQIVYVVLCRKEA